MYIIWHSMLADDPDAPEPDEEEPEELTRWYPWEPDECWENDIWFRRIIFWPTTDAEVETP